MSYFSLNAIKTEEINEIKNDLAFDKELSIYMVPFMRVPYQIILTITEALFIAGTFFALKDVLTYFKIDQFFKSMSTTTSKIIIICIVFLFLMSQKINKYLKYSDHQITPKKKKQLDALEDFIRIIAYLTTALLLKPFIDKFSKKHLATTFWLFMATIISCIIRKILKWYYFSVGSGKDEMRPWTTIKYSQKTAIPKIQTTQ